MAKTESVTILMGLHNGAAHLADQLESIAAQDHADWRLIGSDDASRDRTRDILGDFAADHPQKVDLRKGPAQGFAANYLSLIRALPRDAGFVALADQDDIWQPDKLSRALAALRESGDAPTLYAARYWVWHPAADNRHAVPEPARAPSFRNALVENIAIGNTVVLNPAAARIARQAAQQTDAVFAQDWWLYLLITGVGGQVVFDAGPPVVLYRQHEDNVIGGGRGLTAQLRRKLKATGGAYAARIDSNIAALNQIRGMLSGENRTLLDEFAAARAAGPRERLARLRALNLYRQSALGTLALWGAAGLGRL